MANLPRQVLCTRSQNLVTPHAQSQLLLCISPIAESLFPHPLSSCVYDLYRAYSSSLFLPEAMTVGPTIGTGLFVGTGQALAVGGPASLILAYIFISGLVFCLTTAIAEISTHSLARNGAMIAHTYHYTSNHIGFAISYLRWIALSVMVPFEVTTAMVNLGLWEPGSSIALRMGAVMGLIFIFNMLPDKIFRRTQALFTGIKVVTAVGLIMISFYLAIRASQPNAIVGGFEYWNDPGAFNQFLLRGDGGRLLGLLYCILCSTITFVFVPELTVQRAEQHDSEPGNSIFRSTRNGNIVMFFLYTMSALATTTMSPFDDQSLTNEGAGAGLSPYVVGANDSEIHLLPVIVTGAIFLSSVASGRSFLHLSSRMLSSMAETGHAPAMFMVRNRWNVPYMAVAISAGFAWLTYLSMATSSSRVFNYLMFFITTSGYLSWMCSCISYLQFRRVVNKAEILPVHRSFVQPYGAWFALVVSLLLTTLNLLQIVVAPVPQFNPFNAVPAYLAVGMFGLMYGGHRLITAVRKKSAQLEAPPVEVRGELDEEQSQEQVIEMQMHRREDERPVTPTPHAFP
ncbi:putative proline permease [Aspergillus stella-maris]|uniref:putative proline permease n=1 Tax=Aspergillus stella-maris TaxID=1810926 RepID=UPI003CCD0627